MKTLKVNGYCVIPEKYPYPYHGRFFKLNPPPLQKLRFSVILLFKKLGFETPLPLEFPLTFHGVGTDIFWNYTLAVQVQGRMIVWYGRMVE